MDSVLVLAGQDASIAANVHRWTLIYLAILPAYVIRTIASRFLSSQGISKPMLIITPIVCLLWHPLLLYIVFQVFGETDFMWAPVCNVITAYFEAIGVVGYCVIMKSHHPLSLQRLSCSEVFRWKSWSVDVNVDESGNVNETDRVMSAANYGMRQYIRLLFAGPYTTFPNIPCIS